jgi:serine/threonine protein kinase
MFGESYGKPVDIWAAGFIMYELISNIHPLWVKGEDKPTYKEKIKNLKSFDFTKAKFSK